MTDTFKIALVQTSAQADMHTTLDRAGEMARDAAAQGANMLQFAEFFSCYNVDEKGIHTGPLPEESHPAIVQFSKLADELKVWINLGSITVPAPDGRAYNRQYMIDDQGIVRATYEKIHLFDVNLADDDRYRESASLCPGERAVIVDTPWGRTGLTICYDVRFPHLYRDLAKAGADFLTVPAAFTHRTGQDHWHVLLRARAIETGCFVFATCQSGKHGKARTYGHSLVVNPWGEIIAEGPEDDEAIVIAEIDPAEVAQARSRIPALEHDRPYAKPAPASADAAE
ncbi:carbon-nitrogen hydrolase family protein [Thalassospiraceae bacterium LMO-JJ14]|nr:carbon-nitrogen hydrolase family protein [Thalassospiraceae bacterium LMO-JJ14]